MTPEAEKERERCAMIADEMQRQCITLEHEPQIGAYFCGKRAAAIGIRDAILAGTHGCVAKP